MLMVGALLPVVNLLGDAPLFLKLTPGCDSATRSVRLRALSTAKPPQSVSTILRRAMVWTETVTLPFREAVGPQEPIVAAQSACLCAR